MEKIINLFRKKGVVFYDGSKETGGNIPVVFDIKDIEVTFVDVSREEIQKVLNNYKKLLKWTITKKSPRY